MIKRVCPVCDVSLTERWAKVMARFAAQADFCRNVSPLYHQLFSLIGKRLSEDSAFADWLLSASQHRPSFDVPLLLLAGLHFYILRHSPATQELAVFYPDVGGRADPTSPTLQLALFHALDACQNELGEFLATQAVQTNEGARGLCWLLPLTCTRWPLVHLVELGASAGLNLVADARRYTVTLAGKEEIYTVGRGEDTDFIIQSTGKWMQPDPLTLPQLFSRDGCDLMPISLATPEQQDYLASFVWADQLERLHTLKRGIAALERMNATSTPIRLAPCRLPEELLDYLASLELASVPTLIFNTYITIYLPDRGLTLDQRLASWASRQSFPVLWLQWEHPGDKTVKAPTPGWLAWTAALWQNGVCHRWHLAWVHPHGNRICWLPDWKAWIQFWNTGQP